MFNLARAIPLLGVVFLATILIIISQKPNSSLPPHISTAVWVWENIPESDILYAHKEGIDTIYLSVDSYLDIFELPEGQAKSDKLEQFNQMLVGTLSAAREKNIAVHALSGSDKWANADYWYLPLEVMRFVAEFNKLHPEASFAGVQYDIEFYNSEEYQSSQTTLSIEYLKLVAQLVTQAGKNSQKDFSVGLTMPYWFDNENGNAPIVEWNGNKKPIAWHIFDTLNILPNSYVALMSYRNQASGEGGTISISQAEIEYAQSSAKNVRIVVGQETEKNEVERITFYKKGRKELISSLNEIAAAFGDKTSFGGVAIHTLKGLQALK